MILSTARVQDFDRWMGLFAGQGAEKRRQHGSKGSTGSGCSSTGMPMAIRASSPTPRSRRSCKKQDSWCDIRGGCP